MRFALPKYCPTCGKGYAGYEKCPLHQTPLKERANDQA